MEKLLIELKRVAMLEFNPEITDSMADDYDNAYNEGYDAGKISFARELLKMIE